MKNQEFSPLQSLDCLSRVFPVKGAVVVGAGMGKGVWFDLFQTQGIENVLMLEAEPSNIQYLQKKYASHSQWRILENVVSGQDGECAFYSLSNSAESSLLEPDVLKTLWPNISVREERVCQSVTLDWLAHEKILNGNWLVIDVLPALSILNGALKTLSAFDVIIVRQFIDEHLSDGFQQDIGTLMQQHGFCCFGIEQELHPSLGHAVYVKDSRELALDLKQIQAQSERLQKDWLDRQSAWELEKGDLLKAIKDAEQQVVASDQRLAELTEILQVAQQELTESKHERQEFAERLKQEAEGKEARWLDRQSAWEQEKAELLKEREISQDKAMLNADAMSKQIDGLKKTVHQLQEELAQTKKMLDASEQSNVNLRQSKEKNEQLLRQQEVKEKDLDARIKVLEQEKTNSERALIEANEKEAVTIQSWQMRLNDLDHNYQQAVQERNELVKKQLGLKEELDCAHQEKVAAEKLIEKRSSENQQLCDKIESLTAKHAEIEKKAVQVQKKDGDANIDDMLHDLAPFFSGKMINYVDVGAYKGDVFRKIVDTKTIKIREAHLYEPNPLSYQDLKKNVSEYNIHSLHTYNFAVDSKSGKKQFGAAGPMTKMLSLAVDESKVSNVFSADAYALDDLSEKYTDGHIDLLKIDVEGAEIDVLEGAKNLLREQMVDVIYIEVGFNRDGTQQTYFAKIDAMLQESGYRVFRIYEQKNEWMHDSPLLRRCNFAYMSMPFSNAHPLKKTEELVKLRQDVRELQKKLDLIQKNND
ncbi:FkbM family methyltransferase [Prosthecochloris vibrioformis]|uniref:FkbM family methyltransferase n=1 Tax=Prosthecochloris vibrioformis TaxID=1098 RepID=A0A5C4RYF1_PROVB|nr:FkbM family methyltransferase [Prosthecochloris vibrioformis]TNJ35959.1 FkbM family methyltransferase [Prosthecochloris vibrioformis]